MPATAVDPDLVARCKFWTEVLSAPGRVIFTHPDDFARIDRWVREGGMADFIQVVESHPGITTPGTIFQANIEPNL